MTESDDGKPKSTHRLHRAYDARSAEELAEHYDDWAADYEAHMSSVGYAHPAMVAAMLVRHVPAGDEPILDAGAGTGIMAELLTAMRFEHLVGIDASTGMLERAARRGLYRELHRMVLGEPLEFPADVFAAVVGAGVFTEGHAPLSALDELVRVTRPGGFLVFSVARVYLDGAFEDKSAVLEKAGRWRLRDVSRRYNSTPLEDEIPARVYAYEVT